MNNENYKIGILTHYYNNNNYGGCLQAYALQNAIAKLGYKVELISYDFRNNIIKEKVSILSKIKRSPSTVVSILKKLLYRILYKNFIKSIKEGLNIRNNTFQQFRNRILHSDKISTHKELSTLQQNYDIFITGSDQVWNLQWYVSAFFLDFVPNGKKKISYAASISMSSLTEKQKDIFRNSLKDFNAVSVRESSDVELIKGLSPVPVVCTLDPTLLLNQTDWDEVCDVRIIQEKYVFCYFLGDNVKERQLAVKWAKAKKLKIVTIPMISNYKVINNNFGNYQLYDVTPEKFLSLIKYAECVFTDSFHAVVFSHIYQKEFFVFNRNKKAKMSTRIYNITRIFEVKERFCDCPEKETMSYIESLPAIDYSKNLIELEKLKNFSKEYLINSIEG